MFRLERLRLSDDMMRVLCSDLNHLLAGYSVLCDFGVAGGHIVHYARGGFLAADFEEMTLINLNLT